MSTNRYVDLNLVHDGQTFTADQMNGVIRAIQQLQETTPANVLEKCNHCGQWGAVMCACPSCGAPIDPKPERLMARRGSVSGFDKMMPSGIKWTSST